MRCIALAEPSSVLHPGDCTIQGFLLLSQVAVHLSAVHRIKTYRIAKRMRDGKNSQKFVG